MVDFSYMSGNGAAAPVAQSMAVSSAPTGATFTASVSTTSGGNWLIVTANAGGTAPENIVVVRESDRACRRNLLRSGDRDAFAGCGGEGSGYAYHSGDSGCDDGGPAFVELQLPTRIDQYSDDSKRRGVQFAFRREFHGNGCEHRELACSREWRRNARLNRRFGKCEQSRRWHL